MRRLIRIALVALAALAVLIPAHAAAGNVTVGDFLTKLAHTMNLPASDGATAAASLKAAGVNLPALDLKAPLNEGTVARIAGSMGMKVSTSNPQRAFGQNQMNAFTTSFSSEIQRSGAIVKNPPTQPQPDWSWQDFLNWLRNWWKNHHQHQSRCDP
jgi:hypothetical protein